MKELNRGPLCHPIVRGNIAGYGIKTMLLSSPRHLSIVVRRHRLLGFTDIVHHFSMAAPLWAMNEELRNL